VAARLEVLIKNFKQCTWGFDMRLAYGSGIITKPGNARGQKIEFKISDLTVSAGLEGLQKNVKIETLMVFRPLFPLLAGFVKQTGLTEVAAEETKRMCLPLRVFWRERCPPKLVQSVLQRFKFMTETYLRGCESRN
jgi:hypothetical protein